MKKAKIIVVGYELICPHCLERMEEHKSGSQHWTYMDIEESQGKISYCSSCGKPVAIPKNKED